MKLQYWPHGFLSPDYGTGSVLRTFTKTKDSIVLSATWFYGALSVELGLCFFFCFGHAIEGWRGAKMSSLT